MPRGVSAPGVSARKCLLSRKGGVCPGRLSLVSEFNKQEVLVSNGLTDKLILH